MSAQLDFIFTMVPDDKARAIVMNCVYVCKVTVNCWNFKIAGQVFYVSLDNSKWFLQEAEEAWLCKQEDPTVIKKRWQYLINSSTPINSNLCACVACVACKIGTKIPPRILAPAGMLPGSCWGSQFWGQQEPSQEKVYSCRASSARIPQVLAQVIGRTPFKHKLHKFTCESPNHRDWNQIDHIAINGRYRGLYWIQEPWEVPT